eukprot:CAMPEP_0184228384 /NCGR_PEP_ID=MMETSP0976-20121227/21730_1 /TAXON_ID=483370 /ORGANISM="non described non described, Strain CCMP2097" /LENGTH=68 /DNA_ID=CAMNT_0026533343 /DNA_START=1 /DNA_END=204 /DNA_ORIENTATION=-
MGSAVSLGLSADVQSLGVSDVEGLFLDEPLLYMYAEKARAAGLDGPRLASFTAHELAAALGVPAGGAD